MTAKDFIVNDVLGSWGEELWYRSSSKRKSGLEVGTIYVCEMRVVADGKKKWKRWKGERMNEDEMKSEEQDDRERPTGGPYIDAARSRAGRLGGRRLTEHGHTAPLHSRRTTEISR
jgi:hypothetical protein